MKRARLVMMALGCVALAFGLSFTGCAKSSNTDNAQDQASLALACTDACNTVLACIQEAADPVVIPEEEITAGLAECMDGCTDPADAEDEAVRDCALDCDNSTDCDTYANCLCDCGLEVIGECA